MWFSSLFGSAWLGSVPVHSEGFFKHVVDLVYLVVLNVKLVRLFFLHASGSAPKVGLGCIHVNKIIKIFQDRGYNSGRNGCFSWNYYYDWAFILANLDYGFAKLKGSGTVWSLSLYLFYSANNFYRSYSSYFCLLSFLSILFWYDYMPATSLREVVWLVVVALLALVFGLKVHYFIYLYSSSSRTC